MTIIVVNPRIYEGIASYCIIGYILGGGLLSVRNVWDSNHTSNVYHSADLAPTWSREDQLPNRTHRINCVNEQECADLPPRQQAFLLHFVLVVTPALSRALARPFRFGE